MKDWSFGPKEFGLSVKGISDCNRYLNTAYGPDWNEFGYQTHNHDNWLSMFGITWSPMLYRKKVKIVDRSCAVGTIWKPKATES